MKSAAVVYGDWIAHVDPFAWNCYGYCGCYFPLVFVDRLSLAPLYLHLSPRRLLRYRNVSLDDGHDHCFVDDARFLFPNRHHLLPLLRPDNKVRLIVGVGCRLKIRDKR